MNSVLEVLKMSIKEVTLQLTAYEEYGFVDVDDLKKLIKSEIDIDIDINAYNDFLMDNNYFDDCIYYNDEEFFNTYFSNPMEAVRASYYGNYNYMDEFVTFDGYGNLKSSGYLDGLMDMKEEYVEYYIENNIDFDNEEVEEIIKECNELIKQGY